MQFLLNLLFPKFCIGCNSIGSYICSRCFQQFQFFGQQICPYCFLPEKDGLTHELCISEEALDGSYSLLVYRGLTKKFIKNIKYKRVYAVLDDFFKNLPEQEVSNLITALDKYNIDYIQPVPLHSMRKKIRGFNQSEYIALHLSKLLDTPIINAVLRIKNTSPQAQISKREERIFNINRAFQYIKNDKYKNKNVLLVDDLFTTGSTTKELARELKNQGIGHVFSFTLAHG
ncbi:hypothetical protein BH09PAT1_BH09PAT1_2500 [soil metagenome]